MLLLKNSFCKDSCYRGSVLWVGVKEKGDDVSTFILCRNSFLFVIDVYKWLPSSRKPIRLSQREFQPRL